MPSQSTTATMLQEDAGLDKLFDEVIASPELNLLSDDFEQVDSSQDLIYPMAPAFPAHHPILHRLQQHQPLPLTILKAHVLTTPTNNPGVGPGAISSAGGGISPTLTWSGGPSPVEQDTSPGLHDGDYVDVGGESDGFAPLFSGSGGQQNGNSGVAARRRRSFGSQSAKTNASTRASRSRSIRNSSQSRSRSSRSTSANDDDLALSTLSLISSTSTHVDPSNGEILHVGKPGSRSGLSQPPSPIHDRRHVIDSPATHTRKKSRTLSRSSLDGIVGINGGTDTTDYTSLVQAALSSSLSPTTPSNRLIPTGHRRNITSASLVPLDAPTQIRNYLTPSSTSKKDTPSAFVARKNKIKAKEAARMAANGSGAIGRKRSRDDAGFVDSTGSFDDANAANNGEGDDDDDDVDDGATYDQSNDYHHPLDLYSHISSQPTPSMHLPDPSSNEPSSPTEISDMRQESSPPALDPDLSSETSSLLSAIEAKRRQNTLAARRSRQRKLDYVRNLEELLSVMTRERDEWKERAERAENELGLMEED